MGIGLTLRSFPNARGAWRHLRPRVKTPCWPNRGASADAGAAMRAPRGGLSELNETTQLPSVSAIVEAMHSAQQDIEFHLNWLRSVSEDIAEAYTVLVDAVKGRSREHIEAAWRCAPADVPEGMMLGDRFSVDVRNEVQAFTRQ